MQQTLLELEKNIKRQINSGFIGKINILRAKNNEILGQVYIEDGTIQDFVFIKQKEKRAIEDFVYLLSKGLSVTFITEPEVRIDDKKDLNNPLYEKHQNFFEDLLVLQKRIEALKSLTPPMKTIIKLRKTSFKASCDLNFLEFMVAILVVKFREISKIVIESKYSELETLEALISLRRKGCINVIS